MPLTARPTAHTYAHVHSHVRARMYLSLRARCSFLLVFIHAIEERALARRWRTNDDAEIGYSTRWSLARAYSYARLRNYIRSAFFMLAFVFAYYDRFYDRRKEHEWHWGDIKNPMSIFLCHAWSKRYDSGIYTTAARRVFAKRRNWQENICLFFSFFCFVLTTFFRLSTCPHVCCP